MHRLGKLGNTITVKMPTDEKGLAGRRCPNPACEKYFKLKSGTGLKGEDLPCHCPYCGFVAGSDAFTTPEQLVGDALENVVSAFDGFGRELCRVAAPTATNPADADDVRFQNLIGARARVQKLFGFDMTTSVAVGDWEFACRCFQKRHLLAHKMGVIDDDYLLATNDRAAVVGRKVQITPEEVKRLIDVIRQLGGKLAAQLLPQPAGVQHSTN